MSIVVQQALIVVVTILALLWGWRDARAGQWQGLKKIGVAAGLMLLATLSAIFIEFKGLSQIAPVIQFAVFIVAVPVAYVVARVAGHFAGRA